MAVLFALAAVAIVVIAGLALDSGQSFVSQRALQAGTDTAAQSGAYMLLQDHAACVNGGSMPFTATNIADVVGKIASDAATAQGKATSTPTADFVTYNSSSTPPLTDNGPISVYSTANLCTEGAWTGPSGVKVSATDSHPTFVLQLVGIGTATEDASGTALFGAAGGGAAPFATWNAFCYGGGTGGALAVGDQVVLLDSSWWKDTCGFGTPASFKGYIDPVSQINLPLPVPSCIQTGPGVGVKTPPALTVGQVYLVPMISSYQKGYCPGTSAANSGPYELIYAGLIAVVITSSSPTQIIGQVVNTSPTTGEISICPVGDATCASSTPTNAPFGVELYQ